MTRQETKDLLDVIFLYRPFYKATFKDENDFKKCIDEWESKLKDYDYADIQDNLNDFIKNNESKIPTPFDLMRGVRTITQKNEKGRCFIFCDVCDEKLEVFVDHERHKMDKTEAQRHIDRCHSVRYLKQLYRKWWKVTMQKDEIEKLRKMSQDSFDEIYWSVLRKAYDKMLDGSQEKWYARMALESNGKL